MTLETPLPLHNELAAGSLAARDVEHVLHPSTHLKNHVSSGPTISARAEGVYLWDSNGKQYLEGMAGLWCTALGYGREDLADVAADQMRKLSYSQLFAGRSNEPSILLAEKLKAMVPFDAGKVFFGVSGSDANDTQLKLIWYYNNAIGRPQKKKVISRIRGYHGVTVASGSLTGLPAFHNEFDLPINGILHTSSPHHYSEAHPGETPEDFASRCADDLEAMILREDPDTVAAFIAEPILGAGGVVVPPPTYYAKIQAVLKKYDILFIDDEVICGFGRTGHAFGAEAFAIQPDTMSVAKALSSAYLPISAVLIPDAMFAAFAERSNDLGNFAHGFTYSGHPVCAAVALRNLEIMEELSLFTHARQMGIILQTRLREFAEHPLVGEVRGEGLLAGVELVKQQQPRTPFAASDGVGAFCAKACEEAGLIVRNLGDTLAFCPPLIINEDQVHELIDKFGRGLEATYAWVRKQSLT